MKPRFGSLEKTPRGRVALNWLNTLDNLSIKGVSRENVNLRVEKGLDDVLPKRLEAEELLESPQLSPEFSSVGLGWDGVLFARYKMLESNEIIMPPLSEHRISIQFPFSPQNFGEVTASWYWGGQKFQGRTQPGQTSILERETQAYCQWKGNPDAVHVNLSHQLLVSAAEHTNTSSTDVRILGNVSTHCKNLNALILLLASEAKSGGFYGRMFADAVGYSLAATLLRRHSNKCMKVDKRMRLLSANMLSRALEFIHAHYAQNIGLADVAAIVGVSHFYFARMFKNTTGYSPHQFLIALRISKAQNFLVTAKGISLSEVALLTGFFDQAHFTRHFKNVTGHTPLGWIQQAGH